MVDPLPPTAYPLDLPPRLLILQEVQAVSAAMRRNSRWSSSSSSSASQYYSSHQGRASSAASSLLAVEQKKLASSLGVKKAATDRAKTASVAPGRSGSNGDDLDLMGGFSTLRRRLMDSQDITNIEPIQIIHPFLSVIQSPLASGPITTLALISLHTLIQNILPLFINPTSLTDTNSPPTPLQSALSAVTATLAHCRFPSSSPAQDEVVLLRLLKVIETLVTGPLERDLTDEGVCEMLEVGLGMGGRARLAEGIRRTAQTTVQAIVRAGFVRLKSLDPKTFQRDLVGEGVVIDGGTGGKPEKEAEEENLLEEETKTGMEAKTQVSNNAGEETVITQAQNPQIGEIDPNPPPTPFMPYGLPTLVELLRVLIALLDPNDLTHTDSMRLSALAVLNTALEVGGKHLALWPDLVEGLRDEGCRYLFQLVRSDNPPVLALALRTLSTLFSTLLSHLKLQFELFLTFLIDRLTPPQPAPIPAHLLHIRPNRSSSPRSSSTVDSERHSTPTTPRPLLDSSPILPETKELMMETLAQLATSKSFMVDLYVNYDCDAGSDNVFERLIEFLTRGVYPSPTAPHAGILGMDSLDNSQLLSLEILLGFIGNMTERAEEGGEEWPNNYPKTAVLAASKARKAKLLAGAAEFNAKPKKGVAFLKEHGIIDEEALPSERGTVLALAKFLHKQPRLDKKLLGEYLSHPDNLELLKAFIGLFDFKGKSIAEAMRELLESFRLPGEAQPISRITETFAEHFFSYRPPEIATQDAVYVLAYSVIMLNTDQHNPQNRKRMTIEDYQRNLRGVNNGQNFADEYLASIHESIRKREIIMPQEHVGQAGFDYAWKGLMQRAATAGNTFVCNTSAFDVAMFALSWRPVISAIASAFTGSAQDEYVIQRAVAGFRECAVLAGRLDLPEVFDSVVLSLSNSTGLLDETDEGYQSANHPVVERENQSITVSPLSIRLGTSFRSQLATVVLFTIVNGHGNAIKEGWGQIFEMLQTLFIHSLLPPKLCQLEDFLSGNTSIPLKTSVPQPAREERRAESGLLSTLSSYLLSPYGSSTDALIETSNEDIENTLSAIDCISSCKLEVLYEQILHLAPESLIAAIWSLRSLAEARTSGRSRDFLGGSSQSRADFSGRPLSPAYDEAQQPYDPACVFDLEVMISLASKSPEHIAETWPIIFDYISSLLTSAQSYSILLIERAVVGLLRLCLLICDQPKLRDQLYLALDVLRSLPSTVLNAVSEQLMAGVAKILERDRAVVRSQTEWGLVTALFRATVSHPEASKVTLDVVQKMAIGAVGSGLSQDNYGGVVALLDEFATAAGAAASRQQLGRKGSGSLPPATVGPTVERGIAALDTLFQLKDQIPELVKQSDKSAVEAWNIFWLPPLLAISKQCVNASLQIRQSAITYLSRFLSSPSLLSSPESSLTSIFNKVLFPVLEEMLKPQVYARDPEGMEETRLRASTLLCKVFLQFVMRVEDGVEEVFLKVLDLLERFMAGSRKDSMYEAVPESLKNVVLVMNSSDMLVPPPPPPAQDTRSETQRRLWSSASDRIERFLPGFMGQVLPTVAEVDSVGNPGGEKGKVVVV